jgi:hypothetical protein
MTCLESCLLPIFDMDGALPHAAEYSLVGWQEKMKSKVKVIKGGARKMKIDK